REVVVRSENLAEARDRGRGLRAVDDPADPLEPDPVARLERGDERLPQFLLAAVERLVGIGAVAQRIGLGVAQQVRDDSVPAGGDAVDRVIGEIAQREAARVDLVALRAPFGGERLGERCTGHELRLAALRTDRAAVERDAPGALERLDRDLSPEALHSDGLRHLRARTIGMTNASSIPNTTNA